MTRTCTDCKRDFGATGNNYRCTECRRAYNKRWRLRRVAEGRRVVSRQMPLEYHRAYNATYYARPDVKQRVAERARKRRSNPLDAPKIAARLAVRRALQSGRLVRQPCFCGQTRVDAHHDDYGEPLRVRWLCRTHHVALHAKAEGRDG